MSYSLISLLSESTRVVKDLRRDEIRNRSLKIEGHPSIAKLRLSRWQATHSSEQASLSSSRHTHTHASRNSLLISPAASETGPNNGLSVRAGRIGQLLRGYRLVERSPNLEGCLGERLAKEHPRTFISDERVHRVPSIVNIRWLSSFRRARNNFEF